MTLALWRTSRAAGDMLTFLIVLKTETFKSSSKRRKALTSPVPRLSVPKESHQGRGKGTNW